jgi:hypothetical protein
MGIKNGVGYAFTARNVKIFFLHLENSKTCCDPSLGLVILMHVNEVPIHP